MTERVDDVDDDPGERAPRDRPSGTRSDRRRGGRAARPHDDPPTGVPGTALHALPAFDADGRLRVVVESPRGSTLKLRWEPGLGAFAVSRALPLGLAYPFDWGFVPGTRAEDGDPLDALVLHDAATWPGLVLPCTALAVLEVEQADGQGGRERNDRLLVRPCWRAADAARAAAPEDLDAAVRDELEHFFLAAVRGMDKEARIVGWRDAAAARALVARTGGAPPGG